LRVMLLGETRDRDPQTRAAIDEAKLPDYVEVVEVPPVKPYGKQRALNFGAHKVLQDRSKKFRAGLCVVYDAEDRPEPTQLLKAAGAFRAYQKIDPAVVCLQARLAFSNQTSSWVSRLMWVEYAIHFEWVLPGLAHLLRQFVHGAFLGFQGRARGFSTYGHDAGFEDACVGFYQRSLAGVVLFFIGCL